MNQAIKNVIRDLRKNQTPSEEKFWQMVKNRKLRGKKFLRQHVIKYYFKNIERYFIADFYCADRKLVVEIDGNIHENQKEYDEVRTLVINQLGINVIRIKNEEIKDIDLVRSKIMKYL